MRIARKNKERTSWGVPSRPIKKVSVSLFYCRTLQFDVLIEAVPLLPRSTRMRRAFSLNCPIGKNYLQDPVRGEGGSLRCPPEVTTEERGNGISIPGKSKRNFASSSGGKKGEKIYSEVGPPREEPGF